SSSTSGSRRRPAEGSPTSEQPQPPSSAPAPAGDVQRPSGVHAAPGEQSAALAQLLLHVPAMHRYGSQGLGQVASATHAPPLQTRPSAQSDSEAQLVLQAPVASQA